FESTLLLYRAYTQIHSPAEARKRLRLHTPFFIRFASENAYPRAYVTNRLAKKSIDCCYGPFPSRTAAERFLDESLNLFKLRRCSDDLKPDPAFPGCVYSEMKMCLAPCFKGCTDERYAEEAAAVKRYLETRGASLLTEIAGARDAASEAMEFEKAASLHAQMQKAKAAATLVDEMVRPVPQLDALILQPSSTATGPSADVALFLLRGGVLAGPVAFSTLGMRHPNERSGSTSLFAAPVALAPVPLAEDGAAFASDATSSATTALAATTASAAASSPASGSAGSAPGSLLVGSSLGSLDDRLLRAVESLRAESAAAKDMATLSDHLGLLKRWYYRPEKQRVGEIFFAERSGDGQSSGNFPLKKILRGVSRVFAGVAEATAEERAQATCNLHPSR
ncbi:MAG: hypothetical protein ACYCSN_09155, partial [Acidobacteriaceae bacterium]